jgi:thiamine pyrophosphokinase
LFRDSQWTEYRVVTPAKGVDSIVECTLAEDFKFGDLDSLTASIEQKALEFIDDVERFLAVP